MTSPGADRMAAIVRLYYDHVGRAPDSGGLGHFFASNDSIEQIRQLFLNSSETLDVARAVESVREQIETWGGETNILLFGAYGNGNLGDRAMAALVADYIESSFDVKVFTYSDLTTAEYHLSEDGRRLSKSQKPLNPLVMSLFDGLVLGGGGFLAYPHEPAWNPAWAHEIPIPYGILSNGVQNPLPHQLRTLVSNATFATGRDASSVEALAACNPSSFLCPDPILSLSPVSRQAREPGKGTVFILRGPRSSVHEHLCSLVEPDDVVLAFEPAVDHSLVEVFPSLRFATTLDQVNDIINRCEAIISERYHGVILGFLAGKRVFTIEQQEHNRSKLASLIEMLSLSEHYGLIYSRIRPAKNDYPFLEVRAKILEIRENFGGAVHRIFNTFVGRGIEQ